jgi:hypothetical protein
MNHVEGHIDDFGIDTISFAGPLEAKLKAVREAGFSQIMLSARDVVGHDGGVDAPCARCARAAFGSPASRSCATSRGCRATCTSTRSTSPSRCSRCGRWRRAEVLLACSSTSQQAEHRSPTTMGCDLRKLAMPGAAARREVAYEGLSWGRTINEFPQAWDLVCRADIAQPGHRLDSFHAFAPEPRWRTWSLLDPDKIFLVQLADFMWQEIRSVEERITTARHFRVFPGEGVHSEQVAQWVLKLHPSATAATTASRYSTTTTQQMRCPASRRARATRGVAGQRTCCAASVPIPQCDDAARACRPS